MSAGTILGDLLKWESLPQSVPKRFPEVPRAFKKDFQEYPLI